MSGCDACSDHDSSDDEHLPQTRIMEVNGKQQVCGAVCGWDHNDVARHIAISDLFFFVWLGVKPTHLSVVCF